MNDNRALSTAELQEILEYILKLRDAGATCITVCGISAQFPALVTQPKEEELTDTELREPIVEELIPKTLTEEELLEQESIEYDRVLFAHT
jgi:hypothetical protein